MADSNSDWWESEVGDPNVFIRGLMMERTPEKANALQSIIDNQKITFDFDDNEERIFYNADSQSGKINIGLTCSARLMAHAFAYVSAYCVQVERIKNKPETSAPLKDDVRLQAASKLLTWAVGKDVKSQLPEHVAGMVLLQEIENVASLVDDCLDQRHHDIARTLFANALVWILYHEVSHIQMKHTKCLGYESIEQEKQADRMAADWMLDDENLPSSIRGQRQIGIGIALGWLTASTLYLGVGTMTTHPHAHDRLFQIIDKVVESGEEDVWMFVQMVLVLHVQNRALEIDEERIGSDFRANCNYLIDIISKLG